MKKTPPQVNVPTRTEPEAPTTDEVEKPVLIRCTVSENFKDGAVRNQFLALGYTIEWPANEVREIPVEVYKKCRMSGAKIEVVR